MYNLFPSFLSTSILFFYSVSWLLCFCQVHSPCACLMLFRCFSLVPSSLGVVLSLWPLYYSFSLLTVSLCFNASQIVSAEIVSSCISASLLLMLLSHCQCPQSSVRCKQVSSILGATVMVQTMSKYKSLKISSYNRKFSNLSYVSDFFVLPTDKYK